VVLDWLRTGELHMIGFHQMNLLGQFAWSLPFVGAFGENANGLHVGTVVAAVIGLIAAASLLHRLTSEFLAVAFTAVIAVFPGYAVLATTYMTDPLSFACQATCLAIGARALSSSHRRLALLSLAMVIGAFGYTVREQAIAAPAALFLTAFLRPSSPRERPKLVALIVVISAPLVGFTLWRRGLPYAYAPQETLPGVDSIGDVARGIYTLGLALLPLTLLLALENARWRSAPIFARLGSAVTFFGAGGLLLLASHLGRDVTLFPGEYLRKEGFGGDFVITGERVDLFSSAAWVLLSAVAAAGGALLVGTLTTIAAEAVRRRRRSLAAHPPERVRVVLFLHGSVGLVMLTLAGGGHLSDRYLWPPLLGLVATLAPPADQANRTNLPRIASASVIALWVLMLVITIDNRTFAAARWEAGERLVATGLDERDVDAGFEWSGFWSREPIDPDPRAGDPAAGESAYTGIFPDSRRCGVVSASPLRSAGYREVGLHEYRALGITVDRALYLYRATSGCEADG
jgi:hypothetical protein